MLRVKYSMFMFLISILLLPFSSLFAQPASCTAVDVVASFAQAVETNEVSTWQAEMNAGECPAEIREGAAAMVAAFETMNSVEAAKPELPAQNETGLAALLHSPVVWSSVPLQGEAITLRASNALGQDFELQPDYVSPLQSGGNTDNDSLSTALNYAGNYVIGGDQLMMRDPETGLFVIFPLAMFKSSSRNGDLNAITFASGEVVNAELLAKIEDYHHDHEANLRFDDVSLASLPATLVTQNLIHSADEGAVWELSLDNPVNQTFSVVRPSFFGNTRQSNCVGSCGGGTQIMLPQIIVNDQVFGIQLEDFVDLSFGTDSFRYGTQLPITFSPAGGKERTGTLSLNAHDLFLVASIVDTPYSIAVSFDAVDHMHLRRAG